MSLGPLIPWMGDMYDPLPDGPEQRRRNKERLAELEAATPERHERFERAARQTYSADSLGRALREFEDTFGMSSAVFYNRYRENRDDLHLDHIPRFQRHVWASFYRDVQRMQGAA